MTYSNITNEKRERAEKRVKEMKGFFIHLTVYLLVNTMLTLTVFITGMQSGRAFWDIFWDFGTFATWFFWGIGVVSHAVKVFSFNPFFSKEWEERQIKKFMEEDRKQAEKFK